MSTTHFNSLLGVVGLAAFLAGCGSIDPSAPQPRETSETAVTSSELKILEADEAAGRLRLEFSHGARPIQYELLLGPAMKYSPAAEGLAASSELPAFEVDARISDAEGQPFHLQIGGDTFIDPSWSFPRVENFDEQRRLADIRRMREAVPALRQLKLAGTLDQLRLSAIQIGLGVENAPEKSESELVPSAPSGTLQPQAIAGGLTQGTSSVAKWDYRMRVHSLFGGAGQHSAVNLRGWSSSTAIVFNANSCNHGSCADNSNNSTKCTMPGFLTDDGSHTRFFYIERSSNNTVSGGCTTINEWDSTNLNGGAHNCNDDSELQTKAIRADTAQCRTCGSCSSQGFHNFAPGCP